MLFFSHFKAQGRSPIQAPILRKATGVWTCRPSLVVNPLCSESCKHSWPIFSLPHPSTIPFTLISQMCLRWKEIRFHLPKDRKAVFFLGLLHHWMSPVRVRLQLKGVLLTLIDHHKILVPLPVILLSALLSTLFPPWLLILRRPSQKTTTSTAPLMQGSMKH